MAALILYVLLWLWDNRTFDSITKANERKLQAERAYNEREFARSADLYNQITYGSIFSDPAARLNLAHSLYNLGDKKKALKHYDLLSDVENNTIASIANCQIALIKVSQQDTVGALMNLKTALKREPGNTLARKDYIILKKAFSGQEQDSDINSKREKSEQQTVNRNEQQQPQPQPENQEVANDAKKEELLKSLKAMNMSEDQARAILDAMKSNESQYIYQLRRKQYNKMTRQKDEIEW